MGEAGGRAGVFLQTGRGRRRGGRGAAGSARGGFLLPYPSSFSPRCLQSLFGRTKNLLIRTSFFLGLFCMRHTISLSFLPSCTDKPNTCRHRVHGWVLACMINIAQPWRTFARSVSEDVTSFRKTVVLSSGPTTH